MSKIEVPVKVIPVPIAKIALVIICPSCGHHMTVEELKPK